MKFESRFDPWKEHGIPLIASFELNGFNLRSAYKIESRRPYFIYYDKGFIRGCNPPVYVVEEKHPAHRGEVVSLLNVDDILGQRHSVLKAQLMPLNRHYRLVIPSVISRKRDSDQAARIVNNQAEFNLGLVVRLAHKTDKSLVISVKVEQP